jgi:diguanylate cyclase (GGDEF)-like protein/hemerythrin-like metal-binding protein
VNEYVNKYRTGDLSLLLLDIDYFKKVNDTFGHDVGDLVIKDLAILIKSLIDEQFIFSRWGGEEFTILLNNVGEKQALLIAENIRKNVEKRLIPHVGNITISIGATALNEEDTVDDFFKRADKALYKAKRNGRNRVEFIDEDVSSPYATLNLKFKKEWLSGNEGIDDDHKELVELTIRLVEESTIDLYSDETKYLIDDVIDHTIRHFIHEEKILEEIGYPEVYEHKKIHEELIQEVKKLRTKFTSKQLKPASFLSFLFDDLLMGHLVEEDAKFFKYTRNERLGK